MAPSHDLSFIHKRDAEISDLPGGAIAGIVIGIILIVLVSIWRCCPCWKKQRPIDSRDEYKEDVGHERGVVMGSPDVSKAGNTGYDKQGSTKATIVSPMTTGDGSGYGMRGGAGDRSTVVSAISAGENSPENDIRPNHASHVESSSVPRIPEVDGRSHGGRINELNAAPGLHEAANTEAPQALSPPPRYDQIPRRPVAAELPAELPASVPQSEKM